MGKGRLGYLAGEVGRFSAPVPEGRAEAMNRDRHLHPSQNHSQRSETKWTTLAIAWKDIVGSADLLHLLDNHHRTSGERNSMFSPSLHPSCRDGPNPCGTVDLRPLRAQHFARSGGGEDGKLQRKCCNGIGFLQARSECRHLLIGHCREMPSGELLTTREEVIEVTA